MDGAAVVTLPCLSTEGLSATVDDVVHGFALAGKKIGTVFAPQIDGVPAEDVRQCNHRLFITSLIRLTGSGNDRLIS